MSFSTNALIIAIIAVATICLFLTFVTADKSPAAAKIDLLAFIAIASIIANVSLLFSRIWISDRSLHFINRFETWAIPAIIVLQILWGICTVKIKMINESTPPDPEA